MSRTCTVCENPNILNINENLIAGQSYRSIAKQFSLSESAVYRHKNHISQTLVKAKDARESVYADSLLDQVKSLMEKALEILAKAEVEDDLRTALIAVREARGGCELLGKLLGELREYPQVNILISPEWVSLRATILQAIEPYPEAKISITKALENLTDGNDS